MTSTIVLSCSYPLDGTGSTLNIVPIPLEINKKGFLTDKKGNVLWENP